MKSSLKTIVSGWILFILLCLTLTTVTAKDLYVSAKGKSKVASKEQPAGAAIALASCP